MYYIVKYCYTFLECILNLKGKDSASSRPDHSPQAKEKSKKGTTQLEPPQGYVQLLINKIVSNIRIYCNNVILKYVEEDIVLSMNIKLLKFESANNKWESSYTGRYYLCKIASFCCIHISKLDVL